MKPSATFASVVLSLVFPLVAIAQDKPKNVKSPYPAWPHSGVFAILTTPDGANLPATASVEQFPLLVRLTSDWFNFSQAMEHGEDLRFSSETGEPMAYEIEEWDKVKGSATIWVRVPRITGNSQQAVRMYWGKADAVAESNSKAVFNESNGFLSVWHMGGDVKDAVGTLESKDMGTTPAAGVAGEARHFAGQQGISGGDHITGYPSGSDASTTEAWIHAEKSNASIIGWGDQKQQGKVVMQFRSPPHAVMDCWFSDANVDGKTHLPLGEWNHVVHTYRQGEAILYVNGVLDASNTRGGGPLKIPNPARLSIGGWAGSYDFAGDLDEVRVSKVTRSAEWVRLEHENQKPLNTLVGPLIQPGIAFSVSPEKVVVEEGKSIVFTALAGGARKVYWLLKRDGREEVVAADCFHFTFTPGRVTGDQAATLHFKAVYADGVKTKDIPIRIKESIPDPVFSLAYPPAWDGRTTIEVVPLATQVAPLVANLEAMRVKGAGDLKVTWSVGPLAVIKEASPEKLILKRAQNSGKLTVTASISNGGAPVTQSCTIDVDRKSVV